MCINYYYMNILPIVKLCRFTNELRLFTRVNRTRHSTIFRLNGMISNKKTPDSIQIAPTEYITDELFGKYMAYSLTPTCKIIGKDVVSMCDMQPGDQITYKCCFQNPLTAQHSWTKKRDIPKKTWSE